LEVGEVFCLSINVLSKGKLHKCLLLARQSANNFDEIFMAEHNKLFVTYSVIENAEIFIYRVT